MDDLTLIHCTVTQAMIDVGTHWGTTCPLALAVKAELKPDVHLRVGPVSFEITGEGRYETALPGGLAAWVGAYDGIYLGLETHPFQFVLAVPEWAVA